VSRATAADRARLGERFAQFCAIPSPSGHEAALREHVAGLLDGAGWTTSVDAAGNLLARRPGDGGDGVPSICLCAHLDTVAAPGDPAEPVLVDDGWENRHDAVLGADNKAALAVMLVAALGDDRPPVDVELLFTVGEERALEGAKAFDVSTLRSPLAYVFDHATPIGEIVVASPTYYRFAVEMIGRAAHAGIRPEDGRSAIVAAARAIAALPHGRLDDATTVNVGSIAGGGPGTNIVAERCRFVGEVRSIDGARAEAVVGEVVDAVHDAANDPSCDVDADVVVERLFDGYRHRSTAPGIAVAEAALTACGYTPRPIASGGGSDANALIATGLPCVCLANGTERNHQPDERVSVAALDGMLDVTLALLDALAAG